MRVMAYTIAVLSDFDTLDYKKLGCEVFLPFLQTAKNCCFEGLYHRRNY